MCFPVLYIVVGFSRMHGGNDIANRVRSGVCFTYLFQNSEPVPYQCRNSVKLP